MQDQQRQNHPKLNGPCEDKEPHDDSGCKVKELRQADQFPIVDTIGPNPGMQAEEAEWQPVTEVCDAQPKGRLGQLPNQPVSNHRLRNITQSRTDRGQPVETECRIAQGRKSRRGLRRCHRGL